MKKITIVLLTFVLILSCSKKEDKIIPETALETFEIKSEQTSVKPLEFIIITSSEVSFIQESYKGTINEIEIDLIKTENNELLFTIPSEISIGSAKLTLIIDDKIGKLSFNVIENNIPNIETIVNTEVIEPFNEFENDLDDLIANNSNSQIVKEQLESAKQMISAFLNKYNTLTNNEKMEVAQFFNANPIFTSDFLNLSGKNSLNGNSDYDCFKLNSKKVVYTTVSVLTFINYLPHLTRVGPLGSIAALSAFVAGIYGAVAIISAAQEQLLNDCFLPFENFLKDDSDNTDNFELNNESNYTFQIFSKDRKLVSSDLNSSNSILSTTVRKFNTAKQKWNTLKNGINNIINSTTNWFSGWFGSASSSFKTITYEFKDIPSTSDEIETNGDSEFITIEDFPSDVEVEYSVASDNSIKLKFKADESTLPRTFTGKIKYDDGDFTNENEFSVKLDNQDPCLNMTAPVITNVQLVCENNNVVALVDFTANGTGILTYGGSGWCEPTETCYPVRLYFKNPGATEFSIGYNSYSVSLKSGNSNQGTIAISIYSSSGGCLNGESPSQSLENAFGGYIWKVELMNQCNQRSNQITL